MMRKALAGLLAATLLTVTMAGSAVAADPFQNGSFEEGAFGGPRTDFMAVETPPEFGFITGWIVGGAGVDWKASYWQAADGTKSIDLNHMAAGSISQTFTTAVNDRYRIDFEFSGNPVVSNDCPYDSDPSGPYSRVKTMTVRANPGGTLGAYRFDTTPWSAAPTGNIPMEWINEVYRFTAKASSTTLTFNSTSVSYCGPAIDYVRVTTEKVATAKDCKKGGWKSMVDASGTPFGSQGLCVSFYKK
jgi:choice-of-anchor C domain-containing protein